MVNHTLWTIFVCKTVCNTGKRPGRFDDEASKGGGTGDGRGDDRGIAGCGVITYIVHCNKIFSKIGFKHIFCL